MSTSPCFSCVSPFIELFSQGAPILMYHKLGPEPPGVRFEGYYVGASDFAHQLRELRGRGFRSVLPGDATAGIGTVSVTFDDGYANVLEHGMHALADNGYRAIQYIVAGQIGGSNCWDVEGGEIPERLMDVVQLREWIAAGHAVGSHTLSHVHLTWLPTAIACEEIFVSKHRLEDLLGVPVEHFCYPYGDWDPRVRDLVRAAGYRTACTSAFGVNGADADLLALKRIHARGRPLGGARRLWRQLHRRLRPDKGAQREAASTQAPT